MMIAVAARLAQFLAATVLFGAPLFFLYGMSAQAVGDSARWRRLLLWMSLALLVGALVSLSGQTASMTGDPRAAFDPSSLWTVLSATQFGGAIAVRLTCAVIALLLLLLAPPSRAVWGALGAVGAIALASFAWSGHGAAGSGAAGMVHLIADVLHLLAAGLWLGALAVLAMLLVDARDSRALHRGLQSFSGVGAAVVATLVLTGLVNSWFLIGPTRLGDLFGSTYGLALVAKVLVFAGMLGLAALNRFTLTPRLAGSLDGEGGAAAIRGLRLSVLLETAAAVVVIALVSLLGTLEPPGAMGE